MRCSPAFASSVQATLFAGWIFVFGPLPEEMADRRRDSPEWQRARFNVGSKNDNVGTPDELMKVLRAEFGAMFDPCPLGGKKRGPDGLKRSWKTRSDRQERWAYCNPPYSDAARWIRKGVKELTERGVQSVFLVPARLWRHFQFEIVLPHASEIRIIKGGLKFKGYRAAAPMGSMLIIFRQCKSARPRRPRVTRAGGFEFFHIYL